MPLITHNHASEHHVHGSTFTAYVAPSRGSEQLCAWRLTVPAGLAGATHRPTNDEVLLVVAGDLTITVDDHTNNVAAGDVVLVPADSELRVDGGSVTASVWVTTTPGLQAVLDDGTRMTPPWAL